MFSFSLKFQMVGRLIYRFNLYDVLITVSINYPGLVKYQSGALIRNKATQDKVILCIK